MYSFAALYFITVYLNVFNFSVGKREPEALTIHTTDTDFAQQHACLQALQWLTEFAGLLLFYLSHIYN